MTTMTHTSDFDFGDMQGLVNFGYRALTETCFLLINVKDVVAAKQWVGDLPVSNAVAATPGPDKAVQIAFSVAGLRKLGVKDGVIEDFADEFITGMSGDDSRSRRLGDVGSNAPQYWQWGGDAEQVPQILLLLYAEPGGIKAWRKQLEDEVFSRAFEVLRQLPTRHLGGIEPFGFADGISQPTIDWSRQQSTDPHDRDSFSNLLAIGEIVFGYPNEYRQYTARPLIDPKADPFAAALADAEDQPGLKDFARNGSFLVLRQLEQDVPGFWQFIDRAVDADAEKREQLAAAMVGRQRNGEPLLPAAGEHIPGIADDDRLNHFNYAADPLGNVCPFGAHIRRANPRSGDMPSRSNGLFERLLKILGFGLKRPNDDLVASSRFHRLLRRGQPYGPLLTSENALKAKAPAAERGLQFICLVANISRQFEFVQNAWMMNSKFAGLQQERDPLLAHRQPLHNGDLTDYFNRPDPPGPLRQTGHLPQFITVRGGGYFFLPGLRAIKYLATLPSTSGERTP